MLQNGQHSAKYAGPMRAPVRRLLVLAVPRFQHAFNAIDPQTCALQLELTRLVALASSAVRLPNVTN